MNSVTDGIEVGDVVGLLGDLITERGLGRDDRLPPIRELAVKFRVKAGTDRDAPLTAQAKGLVKVFPRVGAIVKAEEDVSESLISAVTRSFEGVVEQSDQNLFHVLETREALEPMGGTRDVLTRSSHCVAGNVIGLCQ